MRNCIPRTSKYINDSTMTSVVAGVKDSESRFSNSNLKLNSPLDNFDGSRYPDIVPKHRDV